MTVQNTGNRQGYTGDGSSTAFFFPYKIIASTDLKVYVAGTLMTLTTDYSVGTISDTGVTVTMNVAPASGASIVILRDTDKLQQSSLPSTGPFPAKTVETMIDKITLIAQRLGDLIGRSFTLSDSDISNASTTLPTPTANSLLGWNSSANALQNVNPATLATIVAFGTANADQFTGNGVKTNYTLSANPGSAANLAVSVGGVVQSPGTDFTWGGGTTLTFTSAPANGAKILIRYLRGLPQGTTDSGAATFVQAGTGAVGTDAQSKLRQIVNAKDFGASSTNTTGQNKTAVQAAIAYLDTIGGGRLEIDADCPYGYKVRDTTTHPSFTGTTSNIIVIDRSAGSSYVAPAQDGGQVREFYSTYQTSNPLTFASSLASSAVSGTLASNWTGATGPWWVTFSNGNVRAVTLTNGATTATWSTGLTSSATTAATYLNPGNNDGNTRWHRSKWAPFHIISNDSALPPVGDPNRTVTDNRRAHLGYAIDGAISFYHGIGTQSGYNYRDGAMGNFHINRAMVSATAWATGTTYVANQNVTQGGNYYVCLVGHTSGTFATDLANGNWILTAQETTAHQIEYETGRMAWNRDSNGFIAGYHFVERTPGVYQAILESLSANTYFVLRNSTGSSADVSIQNGGGDLKINTNFGVVGWFSSNGRAGIGVSGTPNYKLEVIESRNGQYAASFRNNDATAGYGVSIVSGTTGSTSWSLLDGYDSVGKKIAIYGNGNIVNVNNSYSILSDAKLKTDVVPAGSSWSDFLAYEFVKFRMIADPTGLVQLGVIADQVATVSPGLVDEVPDTAIDADGARVDLGTTTKILKASVLSMKANVVLQEAQRRIEALEADNADLRRRLAAIEARLGA